MFFLGKKKEEKLAPCKPENWNLWPLCIHFHVSLVYSPPPSIIKLLNFWEKKTNCMSNSMSVCCCIEGWCLTTQKLSFLPSQNNIDICPYVFICANLLLYMSRVKTTPTFICPPSPFNTLIFFFFFLMIVFSFFVHFFYDSPSHNKIHQLQAAQFVMILSF